MSRFARVSLTLTNEFHGTTTTIRPESPSPTISAPGT